MPGEPLIEPSSMSEDGQDKPDPPPELKAEGSDKGLSDSPIPSIDLNSEALAHLQVLCEQIDAHVRVFAGVDGKLRRDQLLGELGRFRNTLVLLEKPALEFVVRELILLLETCSTGSEDDTVAVFKVLEDAAAQLHEHVRLMQADVSLDNALSMVTLVNDCRACREDMLLSDVLMLAAEIPMPFVPEISVSDQAWSRQRRLWVEYALANGASLGQQIAHCCREESAGSSAPLIRQLEAFADFAGRHTYLQSLTPLFQCALLLSQAMTNDGIAIGPGLRSLFLQLERTVRRCELVASPADLLPADLLRNLLFYAAQLDGDALETSGLRRRFRLDRVRHASHAVRHSATPTIGIGYHLTNAIRSGIIHETEPLRAWLDTPSGEHGYPGIVRMRVRLTQLEPVLAIMGVATALGCLKSINAQLQGLGSKAPVIEHQRVELAQSLLHLDGLLDQSARRSVMRSTPADAAQVSGSDVYIDMATDACLREARNELQIVVDRLSLLQTDVDQITQIGHHLSLRLSAVNSALQILPLPEVSPLFGYVAMAVRQLFSDVSASRNFNDVYGSDAAIGLVIEQAQAHLKTLLEAMDDYLGCVLLPQPAASQILTDAEETLEQLHILLSQSAQQVQQASNEPHYAAPDEHHQSYKPHDRQSDQLKHAQADQFRQTETDVVMEQQAPDTLDDLSLLEAGSLTLNVDDDLLLDAGMEDIPSSMDSTLRLVFEHECLGHLESLDESISRALRPSTSQESYLPNEQMLRALHTLTGSAQTIDATEVTAIVQPLQRTALELHRQGRHFSAAQTRYIADLVTAIRARLDSTSHGTPISEQVISTESQLADFVSQVVPALGDSAGGVSPVLSIGSGLKSLDDVFQIEASNLMEQLRQAMRSRPFTSQAITAGLASLHTLKGSARMAGKLPISQYAHDLESRIQQAGTVENKRLVFKAGYQQLQTLMLGELGSQSVDDQHGLQSSVEGAAPERSTELANNSSSAEDRILGEATDLTVKQAYLAEQFERLQLIHEDMELSSFRWQELLRSAQIPDTPAVVELIADMEASRIQLKEALRSTEQSQVQSARAGSGLQQALVRARLGRVEELSIRLTETIQDMAEQCNVSVRLVMKGEDLLIERTILSQLSAPLEHLARNAVVHGIETSEQRIGAHKPAVGVIGVDASMDGAELVLLFHDDGRGISPALRERMLCGDNEGGFVSDRQLHEKLFEPGFTSVENADAIAGHGLGLSAVKAAVEKMQGRVCVEASAVGGFRITLRIPQKLIVRQVVLVQIQERFYGMPVQDVRSIRFDNETGSPNSPSEMSELQLSLQEWLGTVQPRQLTSSGRVSGGFDNQASSVLVCVSGRWVSVEVDKVVGYRELITHPLGRQLESLGRFSACSVLPTGQQVLVLDLANLLSASHPSTQGHISDQRAREEVRPLAMVVDDSLTMRLKIQEMLIGSGVDVLVFKDGLSALQRLESELPDIMIVDLEMPRLDGFGVLRGVAKTHPDVAFPIIVCSERNDVHTQQAALELGAASFLAKPYTEAQLRDAMQDAGLRLPDFTIA